MLKPATKIIPQALVLDLDGTIYTGDEHKHFTDRFVDESTKIISAKLNRTLEQAKELTIALYKKYGNSATGYHKEHGIEPGSLIDKTLGALSYAFLSTNKHLASVLSRVDLPIYIFTSSSAKHAHQVLARVGLENYVQGVFDIHISGYRSKIHEETHELMLKYFGMKKGEPFFMCDDYYQNLKPAHKLGAITGWIGDQKSLSDLDFTINYTATNLADLIEAAINDNMIPVRAN